MSNTNTLLPAYVIGAAMLCMTSCTLDDPYGDTGGEMPAQESRISSIKSFGINMIDATYDAQGHLTLIELREAITHNLTWTDGKLTRIETIEWTQEYDYSTDKEINLPTYRDILTNITVDDRGYITGFDSEEFKYSYTYNPDSQQNENTVTGHTFSRSSMSYDSDGHLCRSVNDGETVSLTWTDGLLMQVVDLSDGETHIYEYSDAVNTHLQWDPMLPAAGGLLNITGLFGTAPARFVKKVTMTDDRGYTDTQQYSYRLQDNGLIHTCRFLSNDNEEILPLTYYYEPGIQSVR